MGEFFSLSYPSILTKSSFALIAAADTIMVGRLGTAELAAVGLASMIYMAMISLFMDTVEIVTTFSSQAFGAGRGIESSRRAWHGVYIALLAWPLLAAGAWWFDDLIRLLAPGEPVCSLAVEYGRIRLFGSGLFLVFIALAAFFRGVGKVKTPMALVLLMNALNLVLDYALIFGKFGLPAMGVAGAAWASNISLAAGMLFMLAAFLSPRINLRFRTRESFSPSAKLLLRMVRVGLPSGVQFLVEATAYALFSALIARMGETALAASQVAFQVIAVCFNVCWGASVGVSVLVGQYKGAKRNEVAIKSFVSGSRAALVFLAAAALVMAAAPDFLISLFSHDRAVAQAAAPLLLMAVFFELFDGLGIIAAGALRGAGDTRLPMLISLFGTLGLFLPLSYLFGEVMGGGLSGAWLGATVYIIVVSSAYLVRFQRGQWRALKI